MRNWLRSFRSVFRTIRNAQQGPSESDRLYETIGDDMENIDSPQIQIQPQRGTSNVRNRRQGVPPSYPYLNQPRSVTEAFHHWRPQPPHSTRKRTKSQIPTGMMMT